MDENQHEPTFEESVQQILKTLPPVIRDYITKGKYTEVAEKLMQEHHLRIDQSGVLERELLMLLMGVESPDEFTSALIEEGGINRDEVGVIVREINEQVFVPLRAEEEKEPEPDTTSSVTEESPVAKTPEPVIAAAAPLAPDEDTMLLTDHEEPHMDLGQAVPIALPGSMPPAPVPMAAPAPTPIAAAVPERPVPPVPKPAAPITSYTADPYREPVDEPGA